MADRGRLHLDAARSVRPPRPFRPESGADLGRDHAARTLGEPARRSARVPVDRRAAPAAAQRRDHRPQRARRAARATSARRSVSAHPRARILRRPKRRKHDAARRAGAAAALHRRERRAPRLHHVADGPRVADPRSARVATRLDRIDLFRARRVGREPDPGPRRPRERHSRGRRLRIAVLWHPRSRETAVRHRDRERRARRNVADPAHQRDRRAAHDAGRRDLQAAPLRARWPRDRRLQVSLDDRERGRRSHLYAGDSQRQPRHAFRRVPAEVLDRRAASALQRARGKHEPRRSATARDRGQRAVPAADLGLHGAGTR